MGVGMGVDVGLYHHHHHVGPHMGNMAYGRGAHRFGHGYGHTHHTTSVHRHSNGVAEGVGMLVGVRLLASLC